MLIYHPYSNFNLLFDDFLNSLHLRIKENNNPFQPILIFIENHYIKKYLQLQIAQKINISANLHFLYKNDFIHFFYKKYIDKQEKNLLQKEYLNLIIQKIIKENIKNPIYKELEKYLAGKNPNQFYDLTEIITDLFDKYIYFCNEKLEEWSLEEKKENWQKDLWQKIFSNYEIKLPSLKLTSLIDFIKNKEDFFENIFFFNCGELPDFAIEFLKNTQDEEKIKIDFYSLKILDFQKNKYTKKINQQKEIYSKLSKKNVTSLDDKIENKSTLLTQLKKKLFHSHIKNYTEKLDDKSIQIENFLNKKREIEILKEKILFFFENGIPFENVLIICQDLKQYETLIDMIFNRDDINIPYNIQITRENQLWKQFLSLLNLLEGTLYLKEALPFLQDISPHDSDYFLTLEEGENLKKWFLQNEVFHDYQKDIFSDSLNKIMEQFLKNHLFEEEEFVNLKIDTFEKFLNFYNQLIYFRRRILEFKTIENWMDFFKSIFKFFFNKNYENESDYLQCLTELDTQKKINMEVKQNDDFSFQEIFCFLKQKKLSSSNKEIFLKRGVNFINTFNFQLFSFDAIAIIGVNPNFFTQEKKIPFDSLNFSQKRGYSLKERDHHFFLMTIFYVKSFFYLSFVNETKEQVIPFIIKDFLLQLKEIFPTKKEQDWIKNYTLSGNDLNYFSEEKKYYPVYNTIIAQKIIDSQKEQKKIETSTININKKKSYKKKIQLNELIEYYQNPIEYFQKNNLHLKFDYEEKKMDFYSFPKDKLNPRFFKLYPNLNEIENLDKKKLIEKSILPNKIENNIFSNKYQNFLNSFKKIKEQEIKKFDSIKKEINLKIEDYEISSKINLYFHQEKEFKLFFHSLKKSPYSSFIHFLFNFLFLSCTNENVQKSIFLDIENHYKLILNNNIQNSEKILFSLLEKWNEIIDSNQYLFLPPKTSYNFFIKYIKEKNIDSALKKAFKFWNGSSFQMGEMGEKKYSSMRYFFQEDISEENFKKKIIESASLFLPIMENIQLEKLDIKK